MKKSLLLVSMMFFPAVTLMSCATTGDLEKMQAQQKLIDAKADQALKDAQAAKSVADAAKLNADIATARADEATKQAEERERIADEKANKADAVFQKSMKK
jgi:murein lipoprotein